MNFTKYTNNYPYATKADFTYTYYYKNGELVAKGRISELDHIISKIPLSSCIKEEIFDKEGFYCERNKYRDNDRKLYEQFKADLANELGLTEHPKWDKLFDIAWGQGHSSGYEEVYNYAEMLAELLY